MAAAEYLGAPWAEPQLNQRMSGLHCPNDGCTYARQVVPSDSETAMKEASVEYRAHRAICDPAHSRTTPTTPIKGHGRWRRVNYGRGAPSTA